MYCPVCGKQTIEGQKFCMECGASIANYSARTADSVVGDTPISTAANAAAAVANAAAANSQTLNLNIVQRREPSREAVPLPIGKAMTSMILGILSIMLPFVGYGGIPGVISGVIALILSKEPLTYKNTRASSLASVGKTTSIVGIAYSAYLTVTSLIFTVLYFIFIIIYILFIFMLSYGSMMMYY